MSGRFVAMTRNVRAEAEAYDGKRRYRFELETNLTRTPTYGSPPLGTLTIQWIEGDENGKGESGGSLILGWDAIDALRVLLEDL